MAEKNLKCQSKKRLEIDDFVEEVIKAIEGGLLGEDKLTRLSIAIGRAIAKPLFEETLQLGTLYQNDVYLQSSNIKDNKNLNSVRKNLSRFDKFLNRTKLKYNLIC